MRTSKCSGELTLTLPNMTGRASISARPPWMISPIANAVAGSASDEGSPDHTRSVSRAAARARSRCRTSSATSLGSRMLRPGVSSASVICVSFSSCSRSAIVPSRRSPPTRTNGGPLAGPKIIWSPPTMKSRAGLRACRRKLRRAPCRLGCKKSGIEAHDRARPRSGRLPETARSRGGDRTARRPRLPAVPSRRRWSQARLRRAVRSGASGSETRESVNLRRVRHQGVGAASSAALA